LLSIVRQQIESLRFFFALQCMDLVTTLVFLSKGMEEGNPLVRLSMAIFHAPWIGVAFAKVTAVFIGQYCYRSKRTGLLRKANVGYALVVGWNLFAIAVAALAN
jgi:hypothetical protein